MGGPDSLFRSRSLPSYALPSFVPFRVTRGITGRYGTCSLVYPRFSQPLLTNLHHHHLHISPISLSSPLNPPCAIPLEETSTASCKPGHIPSLTRPFDETVSSLTIRGQSGQRSWTLGQADQLQGDLPRKERETAYLCSTTYLCVRVRVCVCQTFQPPVEHATPASALCNRQTARQPDSQTASQTDRQTDNTLAASLWFFHLSLSHSLSLACGPRLGTTPAPVTTGINITQSTGGYLVLFFLQLLPFYFLSFCILFSGL